MPLPPQSFVISEECIKLATQNGYRRDLGEQDGWRQFGSTTAQGSIWLASEGDAAWLLALDHPGVIAELGLATESMEGPGLARFRFASLTELYAVMMRVYDLSISLPDAPLAAFRKATAHLPRATEAERLVVQRVGQSIFRDRLMTYWNGTCPLTGITEPELLRASHMKPWSACETDAERLNVHNGLLLSALWDAAFDRGLVTFADDGAPIISKRLSETARQALGSGPPLRLTDQHRLYLAWHRRTEFKKKVNVP